LMPIQIRNVIKTMPIHMRILHQVLQYIYWKIGIKIIYFYTKQWLFTIFFLCYGWHRCQVKFFVIGVVRTVSRELTPTEKGRGAIDLSTLQVRELYLTSLAGERVEEGAT
jgi:hypothetical protein